MPWTCLVRSANARGWGRTGQRAQIALASAACPGDLPVDEIGTNRSGSADRLAASCHHLPSAIAAPPRRGTGTARRPPRQG